MLELNQQDAHQYQLKTPLARRKNMRVLPFLRYLIHFFLEICHFFSRFYVRSLEYSYVFSDPNIHFGTEVRSYPKTVPTVL